MAEQQGGGFASGLIIGALAGAALALVLTPRAGNETRELLKQKAKEASDLVTENTGDLRGKVGSIATDLQASASDLYTKGRKLVEDARANVDTAVTEGKSAAEGTRNELERNT